MNDLSPLSPIAQSVMNAYDGAPISDFDIGDRIAIGAAIRVAARKVYSEVHYGGLFRDKLFAIADELEGIYLEKPDSLVDSNLKAEFTSCQQLPASLVPMEYADLESGARIVCEPSEEGSGACWNVLNFSGIHSFEEFPTVQAAWQVMQRVKEARA